MDRGYYAIYVDDEVTIHRRQDRCDETRVLDYIALVEQRRRERETLPPDLDPEIRETNAAASDALILQPFWTVGDAVKAVVDSDLISRRPIHFCPRVWPDKRGR